MIVTRLMGGFGNQMFQYAAGRSLALRLNAELLLDTSLLGREGAFTTTRSYELDAFRLDAAIAPPDLLSSFGKAPSTTRYVERSHAFSDRFYELSGDVMLVGYWQSEKYFLDCAERIRKDFELEAPLSQESRRLLEQMRATNSVSLHIRRGDYLTDRKTRRYHGVLGSRYYQKAVKIVRELSGAVEIFVLSDDIDWCKRELEIPGHELHFVDQTNGGSEDMRLMSSCRNHILANSSFSWWGAWLDPSPGKVVVAPKKWVRDRKVDLRDRVPAGWIKI